jgi:hypothetical protein
MKPTDIIKQGCVAYHVSAGTIGDKMVLKTLGGYKGRSCQILIDDGWSFVCRTPEYKVGQKTRRKPWPTSHSAAAQRSHNKQMDEICEYSWEEEREQFLTGCGHLINDKCVTAYWKWCPYCGRKHRHL